jgi:Na+-translocating ferredoxin:NAD+ oxidoreductase RnfG subunit
MRICVLWVVLLALACACPGVASAAVYLTRSEALREAFGEATVKRKSFILDETQVAAVQKRANARLVSKIVAAYVATIGDSIVGTAFFDTRIVRTRPGVFMTVIAPDLTIREVHVLAFHEPSDYEPSGRWLDQYEGRPLEDGLWPKRDIHNISGATLTARAIAESVRIALALSEILVEPEQVTK